MQSLIVGLLLAGVSGISFIAFKHPHGYARLFPYLILAVTALFVGVTIWHIAVETTWDRIVPHLTDEIHPVAKTGKREVELPYELLSVIYLSVIAYLWVNRKLPPFLQHTDGEGSDDDTEETP